ncbi:hypothetical protein [Microcella sp.]|uniref:hypothetical protein n=1 Tax=Microcella sp. TaxID=1913979 RepID=UPI002566D9A5|nr:hypothetical protein [Microcella sp.]MBX9471660.1 hypothetical protein [Microcella sp.]
MSYDLAVYTSRAASTEELRTLIAKSTGLAVEEGTDRSFTVVRGVRRRYCFTIDGPVVVEAEDVPEDVAALVLGARFLYSISVEGTIESEIPHATRFARRLAEVLDGASSDQQSGEVWSRSRSRMIQKPERHSRVEVLKLRWVCLRDEMKPDAASIFLDTARHILPEALPRRFGEYEPFQGKLALDGEGGFRRAWEESILSLHTSGTVPCLGGYLSAGPSALRPDAFWSLSLDFLAEPIEDARWQVAIRHLFTALADQLPAFYASAEVTGGNIWTGRSIWVDGETEWGINPKAREGWTGLPPLPTWWTWLGHPYEQYFPFLPVDRISSTARGVLYEGSSEPSGPSQLPHLSEWLPADLFSNLAPNPHSVRPAPLLHAVTIPTVLRERGG